MTLSLDLGDNSSSAEKEKKKKNTLQKAIRVYFDVINSFKIGLINRKRGDRHKFVVNMLDCYNVTLHCSKRIRTLVALLRSLSD